MVLPRFTAAALVLALATAVVPAQEGLPHQVHHGLEDSGRPYLVLHPRDKEDFRAAGLDVAIDQGEAGGDRHCISRAHDAGFGDMNAVIQNAANRRRAAGDGIHGLQPLAARADAKAAAR